MTKAEQAQRIKDLEEKLALAFAWAARAVSSDNGVLEAVAASDPEGDYSACDPRDQEIATLKKALEEAHKEAAALRERAKFWWKPEYVRAFPGQSDKVLVNVGAVLGIAEHQVALVKMAKAGKSERGAWAFGASTKYKADNKDKTFDVVELRPDFARRLADRAVEALECDQAKESYSIRFQRSSK